MTFLFAPAFFAGMVLCLSLIMAIGPQNAHVIRMGLLRQHVGLTLVVCMLTDMALISLGVAGLAHFGTLPDKVLGAISGAGALILVWYGAGAAQRFVQPALPATGAVSASPADQPATVVWSEPTGRRRTPSCTSGSCSTPSHCPPP